MSPVTVTGRCTCGRSNWTYTAQPSSATLCNCTLCRPYSPLWIYGWEDDTVTVHGEHSTYRRADLEQPKLDLVFCSHCHSLLCWRGIDRDADGKRRLAVNARLAPMGQVANLPIRHFDGRETFKMLPEDGTAVRDVWF